MDKLANYTLDDIFSCESNRLSQISQERMNKILVQAVPSPRPEMELLKAVSMLLTTPDPLPGPLLST